MCNSTDNEERKSATYWNGSMSAHKARLLVRIQKPIADFIGKAGAQSMLACAGLAVLGD